MTEEEQNRAIAGDCGWKRREDGSMWHIDKQVNAKIPDYVNDLNAMHDAEEILPHFCFAEYVRNIDILTSAMSRRFVMLHATAKQRAEAFLRTKGLWKD